MRFPHPCWAQDTLGAMRRALALALAHRLWERGLRVWKLPVPKQGESPGRAAHTQLGSSSFAGSNEHCSQ